MRLAFALVAALLAWCLCACSPGAEPAHNQITVAAAANLTALCSELGPQFEKQTGIHPVFSFASTTQLMRQIEHAAPYDVFAAADAEHVEELDRKGLLTPGTRAVYAIGVLALWVPQGSNVTIARLEDLRSPDVRVIAIANPELAPYGQAAVEALQRSGLWDEVKSRVVYAENISMARQYGASHNADAVFTAYSLVMGDRGKVIQVDEKLHRPIVQELGIVRSSARQEGARRFVDYVLKGPGRELLRRSGYRIPFGNPGATGVSANPPRAANQ